MNNINTMVERYVPKTIRIKTDEEFIENNLIDLPFIYYYQSKKPPTSVKYEWISSDGIKKYIEVRSSKLGVPTPYDYDVLLALQRIYLSSYGDEIACTNSIKDNVDTTVSFTYRELIQEMGYKSFSKYLKDKVDKSIERLCDTSIYNVGGGLYNPLTKEYIKDFKFQVGILHNYTSYNYFIVEDENGIEKNILDKDSLKNKVTVKIDSFFLKNLLCGKGKISNKTLRLSLKIDVARRLYLILNKWQNGRSDLFFKYETLYDRIPLTNEKSDYYRKRRLKESCQELKDKNFIYNFVFKNNGVEFIFDNMNNNKIDDTNNLLNKYNKYEEIINKLKEYGIQDNELDRYFQLHRISYFQALLRYVEDKKDAIENIKNYIFKGLVVPYENIDQKYYNK